MIRSLAVERIRGIRAGSLEELTPLTVFVGRNGCAKSTLLECLLIAAAKRPGDAIGHAICRRLELPNGARWLLWDAGADGAGKIFITTQRGQQREWTLSLADSVKSELRDRLSQKGLEGPYSEVIGTLTGSPPPDWVVRVGLAANNGSVSDADSSPPDQGPAFHSWLIDSRSGSPRLPLDRLYSRVAGQGRKEEVFATLASVLPTFKQLEILTEDDGRSTLYIHLTDRQRPVPVAVSGDGLISLVRLSCELAASAGSLLLLEEPEVFLHPAAVRQSARIIHAAVRRGLQIVLSTHSLEMIDALLEVATVDEVEKLSVVRLGLDQGQLRSSRHPGSEVRFAREQIGEDLR